MRIFSTVAFGVLLLSCGGGSSSGIPQADACNQASQAACAKVFSCNDLILMAVQGVLGGNEASCRMMVQQNYCAPFQCTAGQIYHPDKAQQCKDQFNAVTCATLGAAALAGGGSAAGVLASVPGCTEVCSAGDAGSGG